MGNPETIFEKFDRMLENLKTLADYNALTEQGDFYYQLMENAIKPLEGVDIDEWSRLRTEALEKNNGALELCQDSLDAVAIISSGHIYCVTIQALALVRDFESAPQVIADANTVLINSVNEQIAESFFMIEEQDEIIKNPAFVVPLEGIDRVEWEALRDEMISGKYLDDEKIKRFLKLSRESELSVWGGTFDSWCAALRLGDVYSGQTENTETKNFDYVLTFVQHSETDKRPYIVYMTAKSAMEAFESFVRTRLGDDTMDNFAYRYNEITDSLEIPGEFSGSGEGYWIYSDLRIERE